MICRLLSYFEIDLASEFLRDMSHLGTYFDAESLKDPKMRDDLIQEVIDYLQSLKIKKKDKNG